MKIVRPLLTVAVVGLLAGCSTTAPTPERTPYAAFTPSEASTPWSTPAPSPAPPSASPVELSDGQRATLDVTFGRTDEGDGLLATYCPMDVAGRSYYADLIARQFDGYTVDTVLTYLEEVCATV